MCIVSASMDGFYDRWKPVVPQPAPYVEIHTIDPTTQQLIEELRQEFRESLKQLREEMEAAMKQDEEEGNPDCGTDEKKERIRKMAEAMGVEVDFLN